MTDPTNDPAEQVRSALELARSGPEQMRQFCAGLDRSDCVRKPGVGKLSLLEHVWHLLDMEEHVFQPRLRRVLDEDDPVLQPIDIEEHEIHDDDLADRELSDIVDAWQAARARTIDLVASTGPDDWTRPLRHPQLGKATFLDLVRRWSRHDGDHIRQVEILSLNCRERNLP